MRRICPTMPKPGHGNWNMQRGMPVNEPHRLPNHRNMRRNDGSLRAMPVEPDSVLELVMRLKPRPVPLPAPEADPLHQRTLRGERFQLHSHMRCASGPVLGQVVRQLDCSLPVPFKLAHSVSTVASGTTWVLRHERRPM